MYIFGTFAAYVKAAILITLFSTQKSRNGNHGIIFFQCYHLSDCYRTQTLNHFVYKQTFNQIAKQTK